MTTGRKRSPKRYSHFYTMARIDKQGATLARLSIHRERGVCTIKRLRARTSYTIPLRQLLEIVMGRIMRDEAERRMR
jgi:hypothetical protein